jgi:hypothetical protein
LPWGLQPGNSTLINELSIRTEAEARLAFAKQNAEYARAEDREFIVNTLLENFKVGRAYEDSAIAQAPKFTTKALQSKADEAKRRAELSKKSVSELREIVRTGHKAAGIDTIPTELTRTTFSKMSTLDQRKAIQRFNAERLNQKWTREEGR